MKFDLLLSQVPLKDEFAEYGEEAFIKSQFEMKESATHDSIATITRAFVSPISYGSIP